METAPRSSVTRTTKESKDVDVPSSHFKTNVASVVEADRPFFFCFDVDDDGRQENKAAMTFCETTRLTSTKVDGPATDGWTVVAKGKCDVMVTDCIM